MFTTNFSELYKTVTEDIGSYVMFLAMMVLIYIFVGSIIRLVIDGIIRIVYTIRAPISTIKVSGVDNNVSD